MYSMMMHIFGGLEQAPMNKTTLGCRSELITRICCARSCEHVTKATNETTVATAYLFHKIVTKVLRDVSGDHDLDGHLSSLPLGLIDLTVGPLADLFVEFQLVEIDQPAEQGRLVVKRSRNWWGSETGIPIATCRAR